MTIDGRLDGPPPVPALPSPYRWQARTPRWLLPLALVWAVVLAGLAVYATRRGAPTVREQTTIAQALPTMDRAAGELLAAARGTAAVPAVGPYVRAEASCELTPVRRGQRYTRDVEFFTAPGTEDALLVHLAVTLPKAYHARPVPLRADAGDYVAMRGATTGTGRVRVVLDTGCRPAGGQVPGPVGPSAPPVPGMAELLRVPAAHVDAISVPCPGSGRAWTVRASGAAAPDSYAQALRGSTPQPLLAERDVYAYRSGPFGVAWRTVDGAEVETVTTDCQ